MIGLDTNVIVRYLTQDNPEQAEAATRLIEAQCSRETPGHITLIVLCELVWVLRKAYGYDKTLITSVLEKILFTSELTIEHEEVAWHAIRAYRAGSADFSDYVILYSNWFASCKITYTFDQKLAQQEKAVLVEHE